ncbi:MAG: YihA family ribosome biogenesis GTP-binding protein [Deltaproteobacteria bacterium]|nr:YihA family ribosome biogenesis GTP-binding protein [Deltaproteobacteria bacterium]MBN2687904.1 YihA family ribosome biogenesis GTP-binding protein [Deltaproteobacteria bacterium]
MKIATVTFLKSATHPTHYPDHDLPEVAFAGRSNVGKSSLINTLVNRKSLAKTSGTPGKTRLINFFLVNNRLSFVDLPGYGFAKVSQSVKKNWGPMIETYLRERKNLRLVVVIFDVRREPSGDDLSLVRWLAHYDRPFLFILTKADKLSKNQAIVRVRKIRAFLGDESGADMVLFSAKTGIGKDVIWQKLLETVQCG